jgi:hypothetical protein
MTHGDIITGRRYVDYVVTLAVRVPGFLGTSPSPPDTRVSGQHTIALFEYQVVPQPACLHGFADGIDAASQHYRRIDRCRTPGREDR